MTKETKSARNRRRLRIPSTFNLVITAAVARGVKFDEFREAIDRLEFGPDGRPATSCGADRFWNDHFPKDAWKADAQLDPLSVAEKIVSDAIAANQALPIHGALRDLCLAVADDVGRRIDRAAPGQDEDDSPAHRATTVALTLLLHSYWGQLREARGGIDGAAL